jgi:hypothetical protein
VHAASDYVPSPLDTSVIVQQLEVCAAPLTVLGCQHEHIARASVQASEREGDLCLKASDREGAVPLSTGR